MKEFFNVIPISFLVGSFLGGFVIWWLKRIITRIDEKKSYIAEKQQAAFIQFLEIWLQRRTDYSDEWQKSFGKASNEMMVWCPDKVLYHIGLYLQAFGKPDAEIHFGNAVLSYRKSLGYKNRWWRRERVTAKHIVEIYSLSKPDAAK